MEPIQIKERVIGTGLKAIRIRNELGEIRGVFTFKPRDFATYERFKELIKNISNEEKSLTERERECKTPDERIELFESYINNYKEQVDFLYGKGSSDILFGDACCFEMIYDFIDMMNEAYEEESNEVINKRKKQAQDYKKKLATNKK